MKYIKNKPLKKKKKKDYLIEDWFKNITKEIAKHSQKEMLKFDRLLPCKKEKRFKLSIGLDNDFIIIKPKYLDWTSYCNSLSQNMLPNKYIYCYSTDDFWYRWKRYKKLKAFYENTI
jgi:hypothetical protein